MRIAWICPTTHWDREWVMTLGEFRVRLADLMRRLLDILDTHPEYRFYADGQAIMLEDFLAVAPDERTRLETHLRSGRLSAGPWYVLADQLIPSGESAVRNLLLGDRVIRELGGRPLELGYVPDSFGSCSALPTILAGAGIRHITFGRGRPWEQFPRAQHEFWWAGPDGATALTASHGYGNGLFLSYPNIWTDIHRKYADPDQTAAAFRRAADEQSERAASRHLYFSVGVDHMEPRADLPGIVRYLRSQWHGEVRFGTPLDYMRGVEAEVDASGKPIDEYQGEMRGSLQHPLGLHGVLSSRMPLKQHNARCESALSAQVEPLLTLAERFGIPMHRQSIVRDLWKTVVGNHPHDSICGCSLDQVHDEMLTRYRSVEKTAAYVTQETTRALVSQISTTGGPPDALAAIVVFRPLAGEGSVPVSGLVRVPQRVPDGPLSICSADGEVVGVARRVACKQMDLESVYMPAEALASVISKDAAPALPDDQVYSVLEVDFMAYDTAGYGWQTWWVCPHRHAPLLVESADSVLDNGLLRVEIHSNGAIELTDKRSDRRWSGLLELVDREDTGHAYDYRGFHTPEEYSTRSLSATIKHLESRPHRADVQISLPWRLPEQLSGDRRSGLTVPADVRITLTLFASEPLLRVRIEYNNQARDHCLRLLFRRPAATDESVAGGPFSVDRRPLRDAHLPWQDEPMHGWVDLSDRAGGLAVITRGLPAYEARRANDHSDLLITLLRCTGQLGEPAGANHPVPGTQCLGNHAFEVVVAPHSGDWRTASLPTLAASTLAPVCAEGASIQSGRLAGVFSCMHLPEMVAPAAWKAAESGAGEILRLWNPDTEPATIPAGCLPTADQGWRCTLLEQPQAPLPSQLIIAPGAIETLLLVTQRPPAEHTAPG